MTQFADVIKAAAKLDGQAVATGAIKVNVRPGSFVSTGKGQTPAGQVVRAIRCGKYTLTEHHVAALFEAMGVKSYDVAAAAALFAHNSD